MVYDSTRAHANKTEYDSKSRASNVQCIRLVDFADSFYILKILVCLIAAPQNRRSLESILESHTISVFQVFLLHRICESLSNLSPA